MNPALIPPQQSRVLHAFGEELHFHLVGSDTDNAFTMFTEITPPGGGPPPHWHDREDEWFHVLEGVVSFFVNGAWTDISAGGSALAPRGQIHTFKNNTDHPTRMLVHASPSGFEDFFQKAATEFAQPEGPNFDFLMQLAADHGIHFVPPDP